MSDPSSESGKTSTFYVPRDETFTEVKQLTFSTNTLLGVLRALVPTAPVNFTAIDSLFNEGASLPPLNKRGWKTLLPRLNKAVVSPETMQSKNFVSWFLHEVKIMK